MAKKWSVVSGIVFFLIAGILPCGPAYAGTPDVIQEAFNIIEKNHIAQPAIKELSFNAANGLNASAACHAKEPNKAANPDLDYKDDATALASFEVAYASCRKNAAVPEEELMSSAINGALKTLDPNSYYMTPKEYGEMMADIRKAPAGAGMEIKKTDKGLTVVSAIKGTPAFSAGIKGGDIIKKIGDGSTEDMSLPEALRLLRGPVGSQLKLLIARAGVDSPMTFEFSRIDVSASIQRVESKTLGEGAGYIRINHFVEGTDVDVSGSIESMEKSPGGLKTLILDLRENPGGLLAQAVSVSSIFLSAGSEVARLKSRAPGMDMRFDARAGGRYYNSPAMIVLVNGGSASASEIVAGALRDNQRAVIMGTRTSGKGSLSTIFPLKNGGSLRLATSRYYTPSGHTFEARGITPDVEVAEEAVADKPLDIAIWAFRKLKNEDLSSKEIAIRLLKSEAKEAIGRGKP